MDIQKNPWFKETRGFNAFDYRHLRMAGTIAGCGGWLSMRV
jgi:hypothetical protein